ncbi:MAG: cysteine--tRNA ligase [Thaumarchaeota archaeon]|jgi:cysteinyl-tRNA synthetase|nr:cysteine--tRNA ligase [Nitrososphaerota archaeon]MBT4057136.1 cysteine--tRNA ligase [Nitrososphaerota archaeon]MBT4509415.1 cysteine--tRNA ligase [Nitrososphaerota archaeon]MBT4973816.1 cysteine--tRNA ligase [Nitrososphaerota archaeon]MBT5237908.1 cysteine--tRNA ligase [Nitrososphaerota archaeon]
MKISDTLTNQKKELEFSDKVRIYLCGVTVYDQSHIGHARTIIVFDTLRRFLEANNIPVELIQNFTDVDDKIINRAKEQGESASGLSTKYIQTYFEDSDRLNIKRATNYPKATEHIEDMINLIKELVDKESAYVSKNGVYFRVSKFSEYGKLSKKKTEDLESGSRIEVDESKENPLDFALWKFSDTQPNWESPWGKGRPGWHIECSAMSIKYLGKNFEIHGGGRDLIFPHHENEIAQSESFTSEQFAKIWMHAGMITINGEKMSKSVGNVKSINHVLETWGPNVARLFCISGHYSKPIDYTEELLKENLIRLRQIETCYYELRLADKTEEFEDISSLLNESKEKFDAALNDDFNTSLGLSVFFNMIKTINSLAADEKITKNISEQTLPVLEYMLEVLGLKVQTVSDDEIKSTFELINKREKLREEKKFEDADKIREEIASLGISLIDHKNKTLWMKKEPIKAEK